MRFAHQLRYPKATSAHRPPLLVLLHGKGANEDDLFALSEHFDPRFAVISIRAPHVMSPGYYRWYERTDTPEGGSLFDGKEIEDSRIYITQCINDCIMGLGADPREVYLFGFSQGAAMAIATALTEPHKVRGVVAVAGRLLAASASHAAAPKALSHLVMLLQHGTEDDVVPFRESQATSALFAEVGIAQGFKQYACGHTITPAMLKDALAFLTVQLDTTLK